MSEHWITVASASTRTDAEQPVGRVRVFGRVIVTAIGVVVIVALLGVFAARHLAELDAVGGAVETADILAEAIVQPIVTDALLTGDPAAIAAVDSEVRDHVLDDSIARVKIWDSTGRILYSDEPRLIGMRFELDDEELDVLVDHRIRADVSDLSESENEFESSDDKLLEAYRPIFTPSGEVLLFEAYFRYDRVDERTAELWRGFAAITLGSIALLVILLLPLVARLLENLRASQVQRESLLQRSLDASADERRRIAGTLHDGVVQDLAATSFSLAGSAERARATGDRGLATDLGTIATTVRGTIGGLRSLLVDIYPPSLENAGLAPTLDDLASTARSRGIDVAVEVAEGLELDADQERLVFRIAQETLQNAAKHSGASTMGVTLAPVAGAVQLDVVDDGAGFDAAAALAKPADGHFGLRVLADLVGAHGGELTLRTAPGEGTHWRLRMVNA